jgi:hypothetical protein
VSRHLTVEPPASTHSDTRDDPQVPARRLPGLEGGGGHPAFGRPRSAEPHAQFREFLIADSLLDDDKVAPRTHVHSIKLVLHGDQLPADHRCYAVKERGADGAAISQAAVQVARGELGATGLNDHSG